MTPSKFSQQFHAIFGYFMVLFYIGVALFLIFYADKWFNIDPAMTGIISVAFIIYGLYRLYVSVRDFKKLFLSKDDDEYQKYDTPTSF